MTEVGRQGTGDFAGKVWDGSAWVRPEDFRPQGWAERNVPAIIVGVVGVALVIAIAWVAVKVLYAV